MQAALALALRTALVLAQDVPVPDEDPAEAAWGAVDWRSRASLGVDVVFEFEGQDTSMHPAGGGTRFEWDATARDLVVDRRGDELLGLRLYREGQGLPDPLRSHVVFFRVSRDGVCRADPPVETLRTPVEMEIPFHEPLRVALPRPGTEREVELAHDLARGDRLRDPVRVVERLAVGTAGEEGLWILSRSWEARGQVGVPFAAGATNLLSMGDECAFDPESSVIRRRLRRVKTRRDEGRGMFDWWRVEVRERSAVVHAGADLDRLREEAAILRVAWMDALSRPRTALVALERYAALEHQLLREAADVIRREATEQEAEDGAVLDEVRAELGGPEAWAALGISDDEAREAIRRGRIGAMFALAGLDPAEHERAFLERERRRGRAQPALDVMASLVSFGREGWGHFFRNVRHGRGVSEQQERDAAAWLARELDELGAR